MGADSQLSNEIVRTAIEQLTGEPPEQLTIAAQPLRGGLTAPAVTAIRATYRDSSGRRRSTRLVLKQLEGRSTRERSIYAELVAAHAGPFAPRLIAVVELSPERPALVLESVRAQTWPWRDPRAAELVVERLASFHAATRSAVNAGALAGWNYDETLATSAAETYQTLLRCRRRAELAALTRTAPAAKRMVLSLHEWRAALLDVLPFGPCVLHGDVHPGNVLLRARRSGRLAEPVLIDWERARAGSALEDVSSWLQSLGFWEPEARRRHDTIFTSYLSALGMERRLTSEIRAAYWVAGASNAFAGALQHHLSLALESPSEHERAAAARAAFSWLRVVRRADAFWS